MRLVLTLREMGRGGADPGKPVVEEHVVPAGNKKDKQFRVGPFVVVWSNDARLGVIYRFSDGHDAMINVQYPLERDGKVDLSFGGHCIDGHWLEISFKPEPQE